jgi:putative proteasome-type protease
VHQPLRAEPMDAPVSNYPAPQVLAEDPGKDQAN